MGCHWLVRVPICPRVPMCTVTYEQLSFSPDLLPFVASAAARMMMVTSDIIQGTRHFHGERGNTITEAGPLLWGCERWWDNDCVLLHSDL